MIHTNIFHTYVTALLFTAFTFLMLPQNLYAQDIYGRFSVDHFLTADTASSHDYSITNVRLKFDVENIFDKNIKFSFKGAERIKLSDSDVTGKIASHRLFAFNIEYQTAGKKLTVITGRQRVEESSGNSVDGLNFRYDLTGKSSIGLFGGLKPDPYKESFHSDFSTFGSYYSFSGEMVNTQAGFIHDLYKGETDRSHVFMRSYIVALAIFQLRQSLTLDLAPVSGGADLTNLDIAADINPVKKLRLSFNYARYKAVQLKRSMPFSIDGNLQQRFRAQAKIRILNSLSFYTNYTYRLRGIDDKTASKIEGGFFGQIPRVNIYYNTRYSDDTYFTAKNSSFFLEFNKTFFDSVDTGVNFEYQKNNPDSEDTDQNVYIYGVTIDYFITKMVYMTVQYDFEQESNYTQNSLYTKLGVRF